MIKLYNTLFQKKEIFEPIKNRSVGIYTCGPTVYWYAHIGNLRTYIFEDILKKVLEYNGYKLKHVMNITDVGHLISDADTGEDKIEKGARRERKTAWEIADFYIKAFKKDIKHLNIGEPDILVRATDTVKDQIKLIQILEKKGFTYKIKDGIYFDSSKLKVYGKLLGGGGRKIRPGARVKMVSGKKNSTDFALWKFTPSGIKRQMEWSSPWGRGFPGWHTECVVMSIKNLGIPFDIHCGGIDHIPIHHTNEIAQAEAAYGKKMANFWIHGEFLNLREGRMGKSEGNIVIISDLIKRGFDPLDYRYLCLGTHYRNRLIFSWEALKNSQNALNVLREKISKIKNKKSAKSLKPTTRTKNYQKEFFRFINDDLDMPRALALMWGLIKDKKVSAKEKLNLLSDFDRIFSLELIASKNLAIPNEVKQLVRKRENYRKNNRWESADSIRNELKERGWWVEDTKNGPIVKKFGTGLV